MEAMTAQEMLETPNLIAVGVSGDDVRRRMHGATTTFVRVFEIHVDAVPQAVPARTDAGEFRIVGRPATLDDAVKRVQTMHDAAKRVNNEILVLCHGGPIAEPQDAQWILSQCPGCHGFYGASSMERLPTELALTETARRFAQITR